MLMSVKRGRDVQFLGGNQVGKQGGKRGAGKDAAVSDSGDPVAGKDGRAE